MTDRLIKRDRFLDAVKAGPVVMGILNITPDSFSDGGCFNALDDAVARAAAIASAGAAVVDVGAESTRPGASPVSLEDELARLEPVLGAICAASPVAISVDTYKADVARRSAELGAAIINDIWGLQGDPAMAEVAAASQCAVIVMHNRHDIDADRDIIDDILRFFEQSLTIARKAGIAEHHVILDPGIGFAKTPEQNYAVLARLERLKCFDRPILLGLSRKRMIGEATGRPTDQRMAGTLAANMLGLCGGANIIRVHDVAEHVDAVRIFSRTASAR
ncbi:dihydropteroate synthase [Martelella alba]|uniref:Dihydropteroate synthase n=1 Tax=Martelella alba TaxID=2590451 RepID=A0A506U6J0_9HYPH|nr:dihydropteroate synthase [Martelella alba]TPW28229.1 dihydropteroate synthase [Martelella alba]